jgi:molybdenum cofactor guanylyltransferase
MGRPKLSLPFGDETMLARVVRIVGEVVSPIVVVAADGQELPALPPGTIVARDEVEGRGPLAGLAAGLDALQGRADAAFVTACDVPLLKGAFVRALVDALRFHEAAVARDSERWHPLPGVYRTTLVARARQLLLSGRPGPLHLAQESDTQLVDVAGLRIVDPDLESLSNVNTPAEYEAALRASGIRPA